MIYYYYDYLSSFSSSKVIFDLTFPNFSFDSLSKTALEGACFFEGVWVGVEDESWPYKGLALSFFLDKVPDFYAYST